MENVEKIIQTIANTANCLVVERQEPAEVNVGYALPEDLRYYLQTYQFITLFETAEYPIKIIGNEDFKRANPIIIGENAEDDISHHWFIIGTADNSQYLTIDLAKERLGKCYDSFWDRHGVVGEQPVIAYSFTELLQRLYDNKGEYYYWLREDFQNLGDAYDSEPQPA